MSSSIKYSEMMFSSDEEAKKKVKSIEDKAHEVVGLPYSFNVGGVTQRGRVYKVDETHYIIAKPRIGRYKVWVIEVGVFAICDIDESQRSAAIVFLERSEEERKQMEDEYELLKIKKEELEKKIPKVFVARDKSVEMMRRENMVIARRIRVLEHDLRGVMIKCCLYHSAGRRAGQLTAYAEVKEKINPVPNGLCRRFCPQCWADMCKAYLPIFNDEEMKKRTRTYRGMSMLCVEDPWWSVKKVGWGVATRRTADMDEVWRFWKVEK